MRYLHRYTLHLSPIVLAWIIGLFLAACQSPKKGFDIEEVPEQQDYIESLSGNSQQIGDSSNDNAGDHSQETESNQDSTGFFPKIIAHRGYWHAEGACQNSLAGISAAAALGADGIDFDLWKTKDDSVVVAHDATHGGMNILNTKYADLAKVPLENGEPLPTLRAFLECVRNYPDLILFFELKTHVAAEPVLNIYRAFDLPNPALFMSFDAKACQKIIAADKTLPVLILRSSGNPDDPTDLLKQGYTGLAYQHGYLKNNLSVLEEGKALGLSFALWTANSTSLYDWAREEEISYFITDDPAGILKYRRKLIL